MQTSGEPSVTTSSVSRRPLSSVLNWATQGLRILISMYIHLSFCSLFFFTETFFFYRVSLMIWIRMYWRHYLLILGN